MFQKQSHKRLNQRAKEQHATNNVCQYTVNLKDTFGKSPILDSWESHITLSSNIMIDDFILLNL